MIVFWKQVQGPYSLSNRKIILAIQNHWVHLPAQHIQQEAATMAQPTVLPPLSLSNTAICRKNKVEGYPGHQLGPTSHESLLNGLVVEGAANIQYNIQHKLA